MAYEADHLLCKLSPGLASNPSTPYFGHFNRQKKDIFYYNGHIWQADGSYKHGGCAQDFPPSESGHTIFRGGTDDAKV